MNSRFPALLSGIILATMIGGCSEKEYGSAFCPAGPRDTLTIYPEAGMQHITVLPDTLVGRDEDPGMAGMESLYLGSDGGTRSSILVNFDITRRDTSLYPDHLLNIDNIKSVKLSLTKYRPYAAFRDSITEYGPVSVPSGRPLDLYYDVRQLGQPFDPDDYRIWPGPVPSKLPNEIIRIDSLPDQSDEPYLRVYPDVFLEWLEEGEVGLEISLLDMSDPGLVGYVSREATRLGTQVPPLQVGAIAAPNLVVEFVNDWVDTFNVFLIPPSADTSTFEAVEELPDDLIHVQTGLQAYTILTFDVPPLPAGSCLDEVGFSLYSVKDDPLWSDLGECMTIASVDTSGLDLANGRITDRVLRHALRPQGGLCRQATDKSSDPHVIPGRLQVMIYHAGSLPSYGLGDLYFTQNTFLGPSAPEGLRPALKLIYGRSGD